jgi:hypothetical protein
MNRVLTSLIELNVKLDQSERTVLVLKKNIKVLFFEAAVLCTSGHRPHFELNSLSLPVVTLFGRPAFLASSIGESDQKCNFIRKH